MTIGIGSDPGAEQTMTADSAGAAGPAAEEYSGAAPQRVAKRLFHATRPKFFPASVLPVLAGTAWGYAVAGRFDALVFALALFATVCVHAGANVLNDVGDEEIGTDRQNTQRIYPYTGGSRFIQSGIMSATGMARLGIALLGAAALAGTVLVWLEGVMIVVFGLTGVLAAVLYSLGPLRISATGFGELTVGFAFGVLPVCGAAWLQSGIIDAGVIAFSLPISAWVAAILLINEVPDVDADAACGKRTLPVRIGERGTALVYLAMHGFAAAVTVWQAAIGALPPLAPLVPLLLLALAVRAARSIARGVADRAALTGGIEATLGIHTIGSLWLIAVMLYVALG